MYHFIPIGIHGSPTGERFLVVIGLVVVGVEGGGFKLPGTGVDVDVVVVRQIKTDLLVCDLVDSIEHQSVVTEPDCVVGLFSHWPHRSSDSRH